MVKRKHPDNNNMDNYYECIEREVKKLNDMLMRARYKRRLSLSSDSSSSDSESAGSASQQCSRAHGPSSPTPLCIQDVPIQANESAVPYATTEPLPSTSATVEPHPSTSTIEEPQLSTSATAAPPIQHVPAELSDELLKILGDDPSEIKSYGKEIQADLAIRLQHLATSGLTKETRKELMDKYLLPSNCHLIDAPTLNPEVRAAISEVTHKRDKAIEQKQKQLSSATACIGQALTFLMAETSKNTALIQSLMDASKILCDIQYTDSLTRRNFVLSNLKKELKDQLQATKIDKMLFSEALPDALRAAKAISKTGADLKITQVKKSTKNFPKNTQKNLNWRAPPPSQFRQKGNQRTKEPAYRTRHETSSKQSSRQVQSTRSRR